MYPFINVFGTQIPTYGICMLLGVALIVLLATLKGKKNGVNFESIIIVTAIAVFLSLLGGYILYIVVTYSVDGLIVMMSQGDFSFLNNRGIVFYGALIGAVVGVFASLKIVGLKLKTVEKLFVPYAPLGHAIGRVGCALAGCCYGMKYDGPLAIYYSNAITGLSPDIGYFPVQFLEAFFDIFISVALIYYCKKRTKDI